MSYRKSHIKSKIHGIRPKNSIFKKLWFWVAVLVFMVVCTVLYFLLFYPGFQVKNISIMGNEKASAIDIQNVATTVITKKIWGFLPVKSIFLVSKNDLNNKILDYFPSINKLTIKIKFPNTITISVEERGQIGAFCPDKSTNNNCFLIDSKGIIFGKAAIIHEDDFIVRQAGENKEISAGDNVVANRVVDIILKIKKNLKDNLTLDLREAMILSPERLNIITKENWQIFFNIEEGSDTNLQLVKLNTLLNGEITPEVRKSLQYVDLRFKDRAYYK